MTDSRVASLAALLRLAPHADVYDDTALAEYLLARGVQYAPRAPHDCVKQDCIGERYHNHEGEVAPPREPPS